MATNITLKQKKDWAQSLYVNENMTQQEIADKIGVSKTTVNNWINKEHWEKLKTSITVTRDEQLSNLYRMIAELNSGILGRDPGQRTPTSKEADSINKIATAIEKMERETGVSEIISVSKKFLNWLRRIDIQKAKEFSLLMNAFIKDSMK